MTGDSRPIMPWWFYALFIGIGVLFTALGGLFTSQTQRFIALAQEAHGEITDVQVRTDMDGETMYSPVVAFSTPDGARHQFVSDVSTNTRPQVGRQVGVLYNPQSPEDARIKSWSALWMMPAIFLGLGSLLFIVGVALLLTIGRKRISVGQGGSGLDLPGSPG